MTRRPDPLQVFDDLQLGQTVRRSRAERRAAAEQARADVERHLARLGTPAVPQQQPYSTVPADGPNMLEQAGLPELVAACEAAPACPRCRARSTPWQPPGGARRFVCLGCGYDPDRPESG